MTHRRFTLSLMVFTLAFPSCGQDTSKRAVLVPADTSAGSATENSNDDATTKTSDLSSSSNAPAQDWPELEAQAISLRGMTLPTLQSAAEPAANRNPLSAEFISIVAFSAKNADYELRELFEITSLSDGLRKAFSHGFERIRELHDQSEPIDEEFLEISERESELLRQAILEKSTREDLPFLVFALDYLNVLGSNRTLLRGDPRAPTAMEVVIRDELSKESGHDEVLGLLLVALDRYNGLDASTILCRICGDDGDARSLPALVRGYTPTLHSNDPLIEAVLKIDPKHAWLNKYVAFVEGKYADRHRIVTNARSLQQDVLQGRSDTTPTTTAEETAIPALKGTSTTQAATAKVPPPELLDAYVKYSGVKKAMIKGDPREVLKAAQDALKAVDERLKTNADDPRAILLRAYGTLISVEGGHEQALRDLDKAIELGLPEPQQGFAKDLGDSLRKSLADKYNKGYAKRLRAASDAILDDIYESTLPDEERIIALAIRKVCSFRTVAEARQIRKARRSLINAGDRVIEPLMAEISSVVNRAPRSSITPPGLGQSPAIVLAEIGPTPAVENAIKQLVEVLCNQRLDIDDRQFVRHIIKNLIAELARPEYESSSLRDTVASYAVRIEEAGKRLSVRGGGGTPAEQAVGRQFGRYVLEMAARAERLGTSD